MRRHLVLIAFIFSQPILGNDRPQGNQDQVPFSQIVSPSECVLACKKHGEKDYKFFVEAKKVIDSWGMPSEGKVLCGDFSLKFDCTTCEVFCNPNE